MSSVSCEHAAGASDLWFSLAPVQSERGLWECGNLAFFSEISKSRWKSFCDFHGDGISTAPSRSVIAGPWETSGCADVAAGGRPRDAPERVSSGVQLGAPPGVARSA